MSESGCIHKVENTLLVAKREFWNLRLHLSIFRFTSYVTSNVCLLYFNIELKLKMPLWPFLTKSHLHLDLFWCNQLDYIQPSVAPTDIILTHHILTLLQRLISKCVNVSSRSIRQNWFIYPDKPLNLNSSILMIKLPVLWPLWNLVIPQWPFEILVRH